MKKQNKKLVYLVHHVNPKNDDEKLIGVYSTRDKARKAIQPLKQQPGFRDSPKNFKISEQELDRTWWTEGFITWKEAQNSVTEAASSSSKKKK